MMKIHIQTHHYLISLDNFNMIYYVKNILDYYKLLFLDVRIFLIINVRIY